MKLLFSIFVLSQLFTFAQAAEPRPDFIEAQMGFAKSSSPNPACHWASDEELLEVRFELTWQNFEEPLHTGGFSMKEGASSYLVFPAPNEGCTYTGAFGHIPPPALATQPQVSLVFKGSTCKDMLERLNTGTLVVHFYDVPSYMTGGDHTPVMRLQIWDHFSAVDCK